MYCVFEIFMSLCSFTVVNHCFICASATPSLFSAVCLFLSNSLSCKTTLNIVFTKSNQQILKWRLNNKIIFHLQFQIFQASTLITLHVYMVSELSEIFFSNISVVPLFPVLPHLLAVFFCLRIKVPQYRETILSSHSCAERVGLGQLRLHNRHHGRVRRKGNRK